MDRRSKSDSISGHDINSEQFRIAMLNANRADKDFIPNLVRNNKDVRKTLYLMKLDEEYKRKAK